MKELGSHWTDFHEIWYSSIFKKYVEKIQVLLKSERVLYTKIYVHLWKYLVHFFSEWEMFQSKFVDKIKTHFFIFNSFFFSKTVPFMRQCGKILFSRTSNRGRYNTAHVLCMLGNFKNADTHSEYVIPLFSRQKWLRERASMFRCT